MLIVESMSAQPSPAFALVLQSAKGYSYIPVLPTPFRAYIPCLVDQSSSQLGFGPGGLGPPACRATMI